MGLPYQIYKLMTCDIGTGTKKYLFTGHDDNKTVEAREVDLYGASPRQGLGKQIPMTEYRILCKRFGNG